MQVDLTDLELFAQGAPHALFAEMRREGPLHWSPEKDGGGFWSVVHHAHVLAVSRDVETFASAPHGNMIFDQFGEGDPRARMMIEHDPPEHTRQRNLVNRGFSPRRVERLRDFARAQADALVDAALERVHCDFVADVAGRLPTQLIAELVGVEPADRETVYELANRVMAFADPEFGGGQGGTNVEAMADMRSFAAALARERRREPRDDMASLLLDAQIDGTALTDEEFELFFLLLITAGIETTRSAVAAGMLAFDSFPAQWQRLRGGDVRLTTVVEEILRWTSPIHHFRRTTMNDTDLCGQAIARGDRVVIWYSAANRDEAVFAAPDRFDVGRAPNEHLAFGFGRHFCLGASLARLELRVTLEALLDRDVRLELDGDVEWLRSNFAQSPKRMPVHLTA